MDKKFDSTSNSLQVINLLINLFGIVSLECNLPENTQRKTLKESFEKHHPGSYNECSNG
jgi:hypothetical protein